MTRKSAKPLRVDEPAFPPAPSHLSAGMKRLWSVILDDYELEPLELELLERALSELDRARQASQAIRRQGAVVEGRYGPKASPWIAIERDSSALAARLIRQLDLEGVVGVPAYRRKGGGV